MALKEDYTEYRGIILLLLAAIGGWFLIQSLLGSVAQVTTSLALQPTPLVLSLLLLFTGFLLKIEIWREILPLFDEGIAFRDAATAYTFYQLTTYIPGLVWQFLGLAEHGTTHGIRRSISVASMLVHLTFNVVAALLVASVFLSQITLVTGPPPVLLGLAAVGGLILVHPAVFGRVLDTVLSVAGQAAVPYTLSYRQNLRFLTLTLGMWALIGTGFLFLVQGVTTTSIGVTTGIGGFTTAWVGGFLTIIVPGGIGVRESIIVLLLHPTTGMASAILISIAARIWWFVPEILFAAIFGAARLYSNRGS